MLKLLIFYQNWVKQEGKDAHAKNCQHSMKQLPEPTLSNGINISTCLAKVEQIMLYLSNAPRLNYHAYQAFFTTPPVNLKMKPPR